MKCLSIRQPNAHDIFFNGKDIENRTWATKYRGPIIIHISKRPHGDLPIGCLFGIVEIVDCVQKSKSKWFDGPNGFVLRNPIPFARPIPYKGSLSLFNVPDEIIKSVHFAKN